MNIFATSDCPLTSAQYLDDKRVIKMILESAQLMCTALVSAGVQAPYRPTHVGHPCTRWTAATRENYRWLFEHFVSLCGEYEARYDKLHACEGYANFFAQEVWALPAGDLTPFANCTPYKELPVHDAYCLVLEDKWKNDKRKPTWYGKERVCG